MVKFLTQEWLDLHRDLAADLPERPGATARLQYLVSGAPDGDVAYHLAVVDGRLAEAELGTDPTAELTLAETYVDAVEIAKGELDANAAYMQGRVKVTGSTGTLMALMPVTQSTEFKALASQVASATEF